MNTGSLYGVYDRKAEYFINVFVSSNDETAKRSFENLFITVEDTVFNLCKNDFTLAKICSLGDLPPCNGNQILVKPMPIYLGADIPGYFIMEKREKSFLNYMKSQMSSPDYSKAKDEAISDEEWAEAEKESLAEESRNN